MRAFYGEELLQGLQAKKTLSVFGNDIFVKPIPDRDIPGVLDPREEALAKKRLEEKKPIALSLQSFREEGFANVNLNTVEMVTKVFPLDLDGLSFSLWQYVPRRPFGTNKRKAVLYVHGGSFVAGSVYAEENPLKYLAEIAACSVFNLDYSLAPEHPFPRAILETRKAISFLKENAESLDIDPNEIYLCGDSAGANIVLGAAQGMDKASLKGLVLFYPVVAMNLESLPFRWREEDFEMEEAYKPLILPRLALGRSDGNVGPLSKLLCSFYLRNGESRLDPLVSPLYANASSFPKTLLFTAEYDGLRQQGEYFAAKANKEGGDCTLIRYRGIHHGFLDKFGYFPQAEDALREVASFLGK